MSDAPIPPPAPIGQATEWDVWNAPNDVVDQLYPKTRQLLIRLRTWQWYFRTVSYLPVVVWGGLLLFALLRPPISSNDIFGAAGVFACMATICYCLVGGGIFIRLWGYTLSALVALLGGLTGCLLGGLLAAAAATGTAATSTTGTAATTTDATAAAVAHAATATTATAATTGAAPAVLWYLLLALALGMLSLLAMLHILLLILVTVRIRVLGTVQLSRELRNVGTNLVEEWKQRQAARQAAAAAAAAAELPASPTNPPALPPADPPPPQP